MANKKLHCRPDFCNIIGRISPEIKAKVKTALALAANQNHRTLDARHEHNDSEFEILSDWNVSEDRFHVPLAQGGPLIICIKCLIKALDSQQQCQQQYSRYLHWSNNIHCYKSPTDAAKRARLKLFLDHLLAHLQANYYDKGGIWYTGEVQKATFNSYRASLQGVGGISEPYFTCYWKFNYPNLKSGFPPKKKKKKKSITAVVTEKSAPGPKQTTLMENHEVQQEQGTGRRDDTPLDAAAKTDETSISKSLPNMATSPSASTKKSPSASTTKAPSPSTTESPLTLSERRKKRPRASVPAKYKPSENSKIVETRKKRHRDSPAKYKAPENSENVEMPKKKRRRDFAAPAKRNLSSVRRRANPNLLPEMVGGIPNNPGLDMIWQDEFQRPELQPGEIARLKLKISNVVYHDDIIEIGLPTELVEAMKMKIVKGPTGFDTVLKNPKSIENDWECQLYDKSKEGGSDIRYVVPTTLEKLRWVWDILINDGQLGTLLKLLPDFLDTSKICMADLNFIWLSFKSKQEGMHTDMESGSGEMGTLLIPIDLPEGTNPEILLENKVDPKLGKPISMKKMQILSRCCAYKYRPEAALFFKAGVYHNSHCVVPSDDGRLMLSLHIGNWSKDSYELLAKKSFKLPAVKELTKKSWKQEFTVDLEEGNSYLST